MVIVWVLILVGGADIGTSSLGASSFVSHRLQLLDLEVAGESLSEAPDVAVKEPLEADDVIEVGRPSKTNLVLVPVDIGLIKAGDRVFRKSRYAVGGVMGVFKLSSRLIQAKVGVVADMTMGDLSSDG